MALLTYDVTVVGQKNVDTALASLERKFGRHNDRVSKQLNRPVKTPAGQDPAKQAIAAQKAASRLAQAEEKRQAREQQRQLDYWSKARQQSNLRNIKLEEQAQKRSSAYALRERQAQERFLRSTVGNTAGRVWSGAKAVGTMGAAAAGIGGAALASAAISQATKLDDISRRLSIQGRAPGEQGVDPQKLSKQFTQAGIETGVAPEDIAKGVASYQSITGDLQGGLKQMKMLGTTAQATGSDVSELAAITANFGKLGVTSIEDVSQALATFAFQGKKGSFELKDQAVELPALLSQQASLGVTGVGGLKDFGGLLQVVQKATGNSSETSTAISNMLRQFMAHGKDFESGKAFGGTAKMNVYTDKTHHNLRSYKDIIPELISKNKGDIGKLNEQLDTRGSKAFNPFTTAFNQTYDAAKKGGASDKDADTQGQNAARKLLEDASNAGGSYREIQRDAQDAMKGFGVQMEMLNTELKAAVASELFPEIVRLGPELKQLVPLVAKATRAFTSLAKFLLDNPFIGIGGAIATSIAIDIGKAKIGNVVADGLKKLFGTGPNTPPTSKGGSGVAGALGAAASGLAIGGSIATAIFTAGVVNFDNAQVTMKESGKSLNDVRGAGIEDLDKVREQVKEQREKVAGLNKPGILQSFDQLLGFSRPGSNAGQGFGLDAWTDKTGGTDSERKTQENFLAEMEKRLQGLEILKEGAEAMKKAGVSQEEAAKRISEAATKMGIALPNRGNSPSPVK